MEFDFYLGAVNPPEKPILRIYTWDRYTISTGCNQKIEKRINEALCAIDQIPIVQRPTGGRELLHGHDLCYTVVWPQIRHINAIEAREYFGKINCILTGVLAKFGVEGHCSPLLTRGRVSSGPCFIQADAGEITVAGRKLMGSAQRVFERCIVQQGSMPLRRAAVDLTKYLNCEDREIVRDKLENTTTFFYNYADDFLTTEELANGFRQGFENLFGNQQSDAMELAENWKIKEKLK